MGKSKSEKDSPRIVGIAKDRERCQLCGRDTGSVTKHHLIPRSKHNKQAKKKYGTECKRRIGYFCKACHSQVHNLFTNAKLAKELNNIASLKVQPEITKYLEWVRKKPDDFVPTSGKRKK